MQVWFEIKSDSKWEFTVLALLYVEIQTLCFILQIKFYQICFVSDQAESLK